MDSHTLQFLQTSILLRASISIPRYTPLVSKIIIVKVHVEIERDREVTEGLRGSTFQGDISSRKSI